MQKQSALASSTPKQTEAESASGHGRASFTEQTALDAGSRGGICALTDLRKIWGGGEEACSIIAPI